MWSGGYSALRDVGDVSFVRWVAEETGPDARFVVQEKVRGMLARFRCDGCEVDFGVDPVAGAAEREGVAEAGVGGEVMEGLYGELVERYRPRLFRLHAHIRQLFPGVRSVTVYGELFGGAYPHRAVARSKGCVPVRTGVYYAPGYEFYAFDIRVEGGNGRLARQDRSGRNDGNGQAHGPAAAAGTVPEGESFLSLTVCSHLFGNHGFLYARTLFQGSLAECLRYPNCFPTHLPDSFGLPPLRNNWCAGTVIRPQAPLFTAAGERVLLKNNNSRLRDAYPTVESTGLYDTAATTSSAIPDVAHEPAAPYLPSVSRECADMLAELRTLFTPALLDRVRRNTGRTHSRKEAARQSAMLRREVLEEFFQLNLNRYDALPACERQHITSSLRQLCDCMVEKGR